MAAVLAALQFAALGLGLVPRGFVEELHARGALPILRAVLGGISAVIPISLGSILVAIGCALCLAALAEALFNLVRWRRGHRTRWRFSWRFVGLSVLAAWLYLLGHGLTLARPRLAERLDLPSVSANDRVALRDEVATATASAARRAREALAPADEDPGFERVALLAREAVLAVLPALGEAETTLPPAAVKPCFPPSLLMRFGVSGVFSPFTFEAHADPALHPLSLPFVAAHEIAHVAGFAGEDEANFVAWLACSRSRSPLLRYSAALVALGFLTRSAAHRKLAGPRVAKDRAAIAARWRRYRTPILRRIQTKVWDRALKAQGVRSGIQSYREMVELLLAWHLRGGPRPNMEDDRVPSEKR